MLSYNDLKKGTKFLYQKQPHEVLEAKLLFKGRGSSVLQTKLKNIISGNILSKTFHPADTFEEIEIEKIKIKFLYSHQKKFWFCENGKPSNRFSLEENIIGSAGKFLKSNMVLEGLVFQNKIVNVSVPIKVNLRVAEAPPGIKGDRSQGGTKMITLESGAKINVPLFINKEDIIEINTETEEYVQRIKKI